MAAIFQKMPVARLQGSSYLAAFFYSRLGLEN